MNVSDIALDLAASYPIASAEEITELVIESIESEAILFNVLSLMTLPDSLQLKKAEFRSKRLPKDRALEKERIEEKIENVRFLKKLKGYYVLALTDATTVAEVYHKEAHGEKVVNTQMLTSSYRKTAVPRPLITTGTQPTIGQMPKYISEKDILGVQLVAPVATNKESSSSLIDILTEVEEIIREGELLSFYNVSQILMLLNYIPINRDDILRRIQSIVFSDITRRNTKFKINCIGVLYDGEDLVPQELRIQHPNATYLVEKIREGMKAIVLNEYQNRHEQLSNQYINGEVSYEMYISNTSLYSYHADELFGAL